MDYDDVIERAAKAICKARYGHLRGFEGRERAYEKEARAAAPILAEYGARLMLENIRGRSGYIDLATIDPATIVREAVK